MGSYDSPGFQDRTPFGPVTQSTGAPGSTPGPFAPTDSLPDTLESGTHGNNAVVVPPGASLANADQVTVSASDTLVGQQADSYGPNRDPLTGIGGDLGQTGAGLGHAGQVAHPNAGGGRP
jgi:hypothetical protein